MEFLNLTRKVRGVRKMQHSWASGCITMKVSIFKFTCVFEVRTPWRDLMQRKCVKAWELTEEQIKKG